MNHNELWEKSRWKIARYAYQNNKFYRKVLENRKISFKELLRKEWEEISVLLRKSVTVLSDRLMQIMEVYVAFCYV